MQTVDLSIQQRPPEWVTDTPSGDGRPARERGLAQKYSNSGQVTTLMLRNIPAMYTQDMLLEEIVECMGSSDFFDFFYLPWDLQNDCNVGYAFVNFRDIGSAERFSRLFSNWNFRKFDSRKSCKVYPAHIQGLENNVRHLMNRAVSEAHTHYPIIMWKGEKLKLGKVIAMLDGQRVQQPPRSAPGRSAGAVAIQDAAPLSFPGQMQIATRPEQPNNLFADEDCYLPVQPMGNILRAPLSAGTTAPPPGLGAPPAPLAAGQMVEGEAQSLQSLPELRAALDLQVGLAPKEPGLVSAGPVVMPASMPGRLPGSNPPGTATSRQVAATRQAPAQVGPASLGNAAVAAPISTKAVQGDMTEKQFKDPDKDVFAKFCRKFGKTGKPAIG
eukprot:CAMPEP_0206540604 /NCGR_PEP_ID=MMETSP0325_2-20121206/9088_1 /ASSEMBLY_ACC=CAM_ASM_000347 /TAXON_ID=2866 /ORGANISM="Crypthecodinium cohnii, Strain Seligo" /LENGTH=383 /DNA_ID=CAMNT_0054038327 /DNA_START=51 /DNA_END=1202 /DNA_ORIENTATION=+